MITSLKHLWRKWQSGEIYVILSALAAQSINVSVGLCQGYSAVMLPCLKYDSPDITSEQSSWIASLGVISNPIGALLGGVLVDAVGRRKTLQSIAVPGLIGWVIISLSTTYLEMCIGRFITGFTIGMSTATYIYVAEISTPHMRGLLAAVGPALVSLGIFLVYVLGSYFHWKTVASTCAAISMITPLLLTVVPESPLWLASKGRVKEAYHAMHWLRQNSKVAQQEIDAFYKNNQTLSQDTIVEKLKAIKQRSVLKPFVILIVFFVFQELSGIYIILYYAVDFFKAVGTSIDAFTASIIVGGLRVCMGVLGACLINQIKRKVLATTSGILLSATMFLAGASNYFGGGPTLKLVCVLAHVCASMVGFLQLPWIMSGELYPQQIRGIMSGVTSSCAYLLIFFNIKTYPWLRETMGNNGTLFLFSGCALLGALFSALFLPETKGKSLAEITENFQHNKDDTAFKKYDIENPMVIDGVYSVRKGSAPSISSTCKIKNRERKFSV